MLEVGDYTKYRNTGTVGKIMEVKDEADLSWVLLDVYDLYYDSRCLEPSSEDQYSKVTYKEKDLEGRLDDIRQLEAMLDEVNIEDITPSGAA